MKQSLEKLQREDQCSYAMFEDGIRELMTTEKTIIVPVVCLETSLFDILGDTMDFGGKFFNGDGDILESNAGDVL